MKFTEKAYVSQLEILKRKLGGELFAEITLDSTAFTDGVCKAGNPISADGKVANSADAVGILLTDVYESNPNATIVKAFATINEANANANAGITISADVKTALKDVVFE